MAETVERVYQRPPRRVVKTDAAGITVVNLLRSYRIPWLDVLGFYLVEGLERIHPIPLVVLPEGDRGFVKLRDGRAVRLAAITTHEDVMSLNALLAHIQELHRSPEVRQLREG